MSLAELGLVDVVGSIGTLVVVLAYFLTQARRLSATDWRFPAMNLSGSILICVSLYHHFNMASVLMECFWIGISLFGIGRALHDVMAGTASDGG